MQWHKCRALCYSKSRPGGGYRSSGRQAAGTVVKVLVPWVLTYLSLSGEEEKRPVVSFLWAMSSFPFVLFPKRKKLPVLSKANGKNTLHSCMVFFSGEERRRHRDTTERGHKRHSFGRFTGGKEKRQREKRHRDKSEGWQKSSCRSNRHTLTDS